MYRTVLVLLSLLILLGCDDCDESASDGGCDPQPAAAIPSEEDPSITATKPTSSRSFWIDDEVAQRTISFTYVGDTVTCSEDAGVSFGACDSDSTFIWESANYSVLHQIKVAPLTGDAVTYDFTPSADYPGLTFLTCDSEVSTNMLFNTFTSTHLAAANKVICLTDGLSITNDTSETAMTFGGDNILLVARHGQTATFSTTRGSGSSSEQSVFTVSGRTGIKFIGLTMTSNTGGSSWIIKADTNSEDIQILHSQLTNPGATGAHYAIYILGSSGNSTPILVDNSTFAMDEAKTGIYVSSGTANLANSVIATKYRGVQVSISANSTITDSTITCTSSDLSDYPLYSFRGTLNVTDSIIEDGCGNGAIVLNDNGFASAIANIESTLLKRTTNNSGNSAAALVAINGSGANLFNSTGNLNRICNEPGSTQDFLAISSGTFSGTWSDNAQLDGGSILDCP